MQATNDGEFYPEKPLERNYKIPKKSPGEMSGGNQAAVPVGIVKDSRTGQTAASVGTPLAASYYNYPYDPNSASAYYQYYNNFAAGPQPGMNFTTPPPPPPLNGTTTVETLTRNIFETYSSIREKPKIYGTGGKKIHNNESETAVAKQGINNKNEAFGNNASQQPAQKVDNFSNIPNAKPDSNIKQGPGNQLFNRPPDFTNKPPPPGPGNQLFNRPPDFTSKPPGPGNQLFNRPPDFTKKPPGPGNQPFNGPPDFTNKPPGPGNQQRFGNAGSVNQGRNNTVPSNKGGLQDRFQTRGNNQQQGFNMQGGNQPRVDNNRGGYQQNVRNQSSTQPRFNNRGDNQNFANQGEYPQRFNHGQGPNQQGVGNQRGGNQQGFGNQRGNQRGFGNQRGNPQGFGNQRGSSQGFGNQRGSPQGFGNQRGNPQGFGNQRGNHQGFNNQRGNKQDTFETRGFGNNQQDFGNRNYGQDHRPYQKFNDNNSWDKGNDQQWGNKDRNRFQGSQNFDQSYDQNHDKPNDRNYRGNDNWVKQNDRSFSGRGRGYGNNQRFNNRQQSQNDGIENQNKPRFGKRPFNDDDKWGYDQYDTCMEKGYGQYSEQGRDHKGFQSNGRFKGVGFVNEKKTKKEPPVEIPVEQTVPDILDTTLPKDLKTLFQPLFCKLCEAQLSSNQSAKMHYKSKNHEKKIRKWLTEYAEKTGEPLHPRAVITGQEKKKDNKEEAEKNPTWFHCDVCDLDLTGKMHAESHYMGRNHQKALLGHKNPAGSGYYDADGKWIRIKNQKSKSFDFEKGEDNFGLAFKASGEAAATSDEPPSKKMKKDPAETKEFHCEVCNINTTNQEQLNTHFMGQKHAKKLKLLGLGTYTEQRKLIEESALVGATGDVPTTPNTAALELNIDVAAHRTPSGDFYCSTCNLTLNSEPQFLQHMQSKGHAKKLVLKKKDDATPAAITSSVLAAAVTSPIITGDDVASSLEKVSELIVE